MQVCTSLQTDNHASTSVLKFFTGRMPFLPPNQQCQSTEGKNNKHHRIKKLIFKLLCFDVAFSVLMLLLGWQKGHTACKKTEWFSTGMVICLERGADLHMAQLMPLPLTVSRFTKIQTGFTILVLAPPR